MYTRLSNDIYECDDGCYSLYEISVCVELNAFHGRQGLQVADAAESLAGFSTRCCVDRAHTVSEERTKKFPCIVSSICRSLCAGDVGLKSSSRGDDSHYTDIESL